MRSRVPAIAVLAVLPLGLSAGKSKTLTPGRAENAAVTVDATAYVDKAGITQLLGSDLGGYYTVLQVTLTPKAGKLNVQRDDFLLRTDKDGEHTHPLAPTEIAGRADLILQEVSAGGSVGTQPTGPMWGGVQLPGGQSIGNRGSNPTTLGTTVNKAKPGKEDPMLAVLKQKILPEQEISQPTTGLLIFNLEKQKLKDLELVYTTASGPLKLRFR